MHTKIKAIKVELKATDVLQFFVVVFLIPQKNFWDLFIYIVIKTLKEMQ